MSEDKLKKFAEDQEGATPLPEAKITPVITPEAPVGNPITNTPKTNMAWHKSESEISRGNEIGWEAIKIMDLPTKGMFYPEGTEISIKSATSAEIRHWSTLNEEDLSILDDMLNYVIERCCNVKFPNNQPSSWKDLKEVDRFYLILAIRERTFVKGENILQVKVSETDKIDVTKDMIEYITFDDRLMKYYDNEKRCISLKFKSSGKFLDIHLASVGVTNWLKKYINRKQQMQEAFDQDFISFATFVIPDWRGLNDSTYEAFVYQSMDWSSDEISMLTEVRKIFADAINPVIRYRDEQGGEREIPLNFRGGIKSIFLVSDPFSKLA